MLLRNGLLHTSPCFCWVKFASIQAKQLAEEKAKEHEEPASKPTTLGPKRRKYVVGDCQNGKGCLHFTKLDDGYIVSISGWDEMNSAQTGWNDQLIHFKFIVADPM